MSLYTFDDETLDELGFEDYSPEERAQIAALLTERLQDRVGDEISAHATELELEDFGAFLDKDVRLMRQWLYAYDRGYQNTERFRTIMADHPDGDEAEILSAYGSLRWIELHCPDYQRIVRENAEDIKLAMQSMNSI